MNDAAVAVTGIACRFPGAPDASAFWNMLVDGQHGTSEVPADRWSNDAGFARSDSRRPPSRYGGFIDGHARFDHAFFGISPAEAAEMDVQQRLLLETAWHAIENAGIDPTDLAGSNTGVYVGMMSSDWTAMAMARPAEMTPHRGTGGGYCMAANRVSYHLDLHGPSMAIDTACSSSLVAIHQAASAIRAGDIDTAIVAGVNVMLSPALSVFYAESGLASPDGRCKPFSARADGIGRGEGVGVVVLQRETSSVRASGLSYARVLSSAVNHDGRSNGISAPSMWSQIDVLSAAYSRASVTPAEVDFVEGHGTGTTLGDMIETRALGKLHGVDRVKPCLLGSLKGNVGHLEGAAGIAGFIKAVLAVKNRILPGSLFADSENASLDLAGKGLHLSGHTARLPRRRIVGGISSFGMGGTNAHVVVGSPESVRSPSRQAGPSVVTVSANDDNALAANARALADFLDAGSDDRFGNLAFSTTAVKSGLGTRLAVVADSAPAAAAALRRATVDHRAFGRGRTRRPVIAFLFTGQGSQYQGMGSALARNCPPYARRLGEALAAADPDLRRDLERVLLSDEDNDLLHRASVAQPALFALQYALATTFTDVGIEPVAVLGHSLGEFAAAVTAGAMSLGRAMTLVAARGRAMDSSSPRGGMLSVRADADTVASLVTLDESLCIAAINGPANVVLAGDSDAVDRAQAALSEFAPKRLRVTHAFHSPAMADAAVRFESEVGDGPEALASRPSRAMRPPGMYSTLHGSRVDLGGLNARYWSAQMTRPVLFLDAFRSLAGEIEPTHVVEIGPNAVLNTLVRELDSAPRQMLVPVPGPKATGTELAQILADLYVGGVDVDWAPLFDEDQRTFRRLPGYVFDHVRHQLPGRPVMRLPESNVESATFEVTPAEIVSTSPEPVSIPTDDSVQDRIFAVIAVLGGFGESEFSRSSSLRDDLAFDSIMAVRLGDRINEIVLPAPPIPVVDLAENLGTVGDLVDFACAYVHSHTRTQILEGAN